MSETQCRKSFVSPRLSLRLALAGSLSLPLLLTLPLFLHPVSLLAQAAAATAVPARQTGTVKSIDGHTLTVVNSAGASVAVPVAPTAPVLQLAPGSTDLKGAQTTTFDTIAVGDRIITGKAGDTDTASRVILMKSTDIAAQKQEQQQDWQRRGSGGLVKTVAGTALTITSGSRTVAIETTPTTIFRRYADDSVDFADSKPGTLADIHPGDQLSVRGDKAPDGSSIKAEEVVTGTFANLSGALSAVDTTAGTITLKDLTTKKIVTVKVTANSDLRKLPAQAAAAFAARNNPSAAPSASAPGGAGSPGGAGAPGGVGGTGGAARRNAGMDLSRMLARLPAEHIADLHPGDAVMIVASQGHGSDPFTAITLLAGVEQLLSAPAGAQPITLQPWNIGGAPEGGGGGQ